MRGLLPRLLWLFAFAWQRGRAQQVSAGDVGNVLGAIGGGPAVTGNAGIEACELARRRGDTVSEHCGRRWALMNAVRVPEFWEVHEVQFFWDPYCTLQLPLSQAQSTPTNTGFELNTADKVVDGRLDTKWSANCRFYLGGCEPRTVWVGYDSGMTQGINTEPHREFASVRCVKVYQSPNISRQSSEMILGTFLDLTDGTFTETEHFREFAGGSWQQRPGYEAGIWRIRNVVPTDRPWKVAELLFYSDRFCTQEANHGVPIASTSFMNTNCVETQSCDGFLPHFAFDGEKKPGHTLPEPLPTYWRAGCNGYSGCAAEEAWIGMDYGARPVTVQCLRIFQPMHDGFPDYGHPTFASTIALEYWDGYMWKASQAVYNLGPGGWNETQPVSGFAWRLNNYDIVLESWRIYELQFFTSRTCGTLGYRERELGQSVDSNARLPFTQQETECSLEIGSCGDLAFDQKTYTAWQSSCKNCQRGQAWIGLMFEGRTREIQCFKVVQSGELPYRADSVELSVWAGTEWEVKRFESGLGGGTWNYRPTEPMSAWRLLATSATDQPWIVAEMALYSDRDCNTEIAANAIGSGGQPTHRVEHSFDGDNTTYFEASCPPRVVGSQGCMPGSTWLGLQAESGTLDVRCFRLQQHALRARQVDVAVLQHWDGLRWVPNQDFAPVRGFSGGAWQSFPGHFGSMWRLRSQAVPGGAGVGVAELEFHRTSDCSAKIEARFPNIVPISSGYATSRDVAVATGASTHYTAMGIFAPAGPEYAFDGNLATFWAELESGSVWVGLDLNTQVADVQCVRLAFAGIRTLQPAWSWVEAWDGSSWSAFTEGGSGLPSALHFAVHSPGGSGWQDRPAALQSMWRLENDVDLQAWEISELEFFSSADCSGAKLAGQAIASARTTPTGVGHGGHGLPMDAFDGRLETTWAADCDFFGCVKGNAWIGLKLAEPARVTCVRLVQGPTVQTQSATATLAFWQGERWEASLHLAGLGGGTWNTRPALPDSMWRVAFVATQEENCLAFPSKTYRRSWGVSELEFYSDDDCQEPLPTEGARPIASGMRVPAQVGRGVLLDSFSPAKAFDGEEGSYWASQCGAVGREEAKCTAGSEWLGLDWGVVSKGMPVEVRCVRIHQSRANSADCCDPASKLTLERWNGTAWVGAVWRHLPRSRGALTIEGDFNGLGRCPALATAITQTYDLWEQRSRRQSETCAVPLSGAVPLLADKLCEKHPACAAAGFKGDCCPTSSNDGTACSQDQFEAGHCSRCCCGVVAKNIFEDQLQLGIDRRPIDEAPVAGLELLVIRVVNVMPYIGLVITLLVYIAANTPFPGKSQTCRTRLWWVLCWPVQSWMEQGGLFGSTLAWVCKRSENERPWVTRLKRLMVVVGGLVIGAYFLWILISVLVAELILRVVLLLSVVVRYAKSPFNPKEPGDRKRFQLVLAVPFPSEGNSFEAPGLGGLLQSVGEALAQALVYCIKGVLDIILVRFSLMALDASFAQVAIPEILVQIPPLPFSLNISGLMNELYVLTSVFTEMFMIIVEQFFQGVPRCEGPVLIFSGMSLLVITLVLIRCLNFDFFGLLIATKTTVKTTRPFFQKIIFLATTMAIQSGIFVAMQCTMLLFARALMLVDFNAEHWLCPYEGEGISSFSGRLFLILTAILASAIIFLSANGHFMGQQQLTTEFAKQINMDLGRLDPDGNDALIRTSFCLSMVPTTLGIWVDRWNVKGYLIKERASVYASELGYPQVCKHCGVAHVPYWEVMKVTGQQLSLSYQWFPFGVVIGKACEYLNNPPLLYIGSELACMRVSENVQRARDGMPKKMTGSSAVLFYLGLLVAHVKDNVVPLISKFLTIAVYCSLIICTYLIDKDNLQEVGYLLFALLMGIASAKALFEIFVPLLMLFILAIVLVMTKRKASQAKKGESFRMLLPFIGQLAHAVPVGMALAIYLMQHERAGQRDLYTMSGCVVGSCAGILIMCIALALESCPGSLLSSRVFIGSYGCALSIGVGLLGGHHLHFDQRILVMVFCTVFLVPLSAIAFRLAPLDGDGVRLPSAVRPMLTGPRLFACVYGSLAGIFVGSYWHQDIAEVVTRRLTERYGGISALLICASLGYCSGLAYCFATDTILKKRAGQWALLVGTFLTLFFGLLVAWFVGVVVGSLAATLVGAALEHFQTKELKKKCFEPLRFVETKATPSPASPYVSEGVEMPPPPTVMKAWVAGNEPEMQNGISLSRPVQDDRQLEAKAPKKYTMGRTAVIPPVPPRDPWKEVEQPAVEVAEARPNSSGQAELPGATIHPALQEQAQSLSEAGRAQLAATLGPRASSSPNTPKPSARARD